MYSPSPSACGYAHLVTLIGETTTDAGLRIRSEIDDGLYLGLYPKAVKITDEQLAQLQLTPHAFHLAAGTTRSIRAYQNNESVINHNPLAR